MWTLSIKLFLNVLFFFFSNLHSGFSSQFDPMPQPFSKCDVLFLNRTYLRRSDRLGREEQERFDERRLLRYTSLPS